MRRFTYTLCRWLATLIFLPVIRWRVLGSGHLPRAGRCLLVANHISHFDPPLLGVAIGRKVDWMAMRELFANRWAAMFFRWIDTFPHDRFRPDRASVRTALERLGKGRLVGVFPEGGLRAGRASLLEGGETREGFGALAQIAGAPVVPCVILGSDRLYGWRAWLPWKRAGVWIAFGEPIPPPPRGAAGRGARGGHERAVKEAMRGLSRELVERFGLGETDLPQEPARRKGRG